MLAPLPNLLYQRDTSSWIYGGVSVNAMAMPARMRETVNDEAIYRWHPMFAGGGFEVWYHGADAAPATIEGGDILVIGNGAVLAGMSERTTPQAVELIAHRLFSAGAARCLVAIDMPKARAFMHLDTVMTMCGLRRVHQVRRDLGMLPSYTVEPGASARELKVTDHPPEDMHTRDRGRARPARHQGADRQPGRPAAAQREQWDDGCNVLAIEPGVVVAYDRNVTTNTYLEENGVEVVTGTRQRAGPGPGRAALHDLPHRAQRLRAYRAAGRVTAVRVRGAWGLCRRRRKPRARGGPPTGPRGPAPSASPSAGPPARLPARTRTRRW